MGWNCVTFKMGMEVFSELRLLKDDAGFEGTKNNN